MLQGRRNFAIFFYKKIIIPKFISLSEELHLRATLKIIPWGFLLNNY